MWVASKYGIIMIATIITGFGELIDHDWSKYKPCSKAGQILFEHLLSMVLGHTGGQVPNVEVSTDL